MVAPASARSSPRTRTWLLALALVSVVPTAGLATWLGVLTVRQTAAHLRDNALARAESLVVATDRYVSNAETSLRMLAQAPSLQSDDLKDFHELIASANPVLGATGIVLLDRSGQQLVSSRVPWGAPLPRSAHLETHLKVFSTGQPAISDLVPAALGNEPILSVEVPVLRDGRVAYVLAAGLPPAQLSTVLQDQALPTSWLAGIMDRHGLIIGRTRHLDEYLGRPPSPDIRAQHGEAVWFPNVSRDGLALYSTLLRSPLTGWSIVVGVPRSEIDDPLRTTLLITLATGLGTLLLAGAAAWLLARRIAVPMRALGRAAMAFGRGEIPTPPPPGLREAEEVGDALRRAAEHASQRLEERDAVLTELQISEHRLRATYSAAPVGIGETDRAGDYRSANERLHEILGYPEGGLLGQSFHLLTAPEDRERELLRYDALWRGEIDSYKLEKRLIRKNGSHVWVSVHASIARDQGTPLYAIRIIQDISDRVRADDVLREAEARLRTLNQELEARVHAEVSAREAAQVRAAHAERMQALGQLAGGIAHDFNNVLQSVQGGAALIATRADDDGLRRLAQLILDAAGRGASVTRRLLAFSRHGDLRAEPIPPAELLYGLTEVLEPALGPMVRMRIEAASDLPSVIADKGQLETALINLATNARDAMLSGGSLVLSAVAETMSDRPNALGLRPGRYVRFTVTDTGAGMDATILARVTEPFFTTKPAGEGTGLGLPMVKGFAEQSGGAFLIESRPGAGTQVAIWLPQVESRLVRPSGVPEPERAMRARVLLVDDDATIRELMSSLLEDMEYATLVAQSGVEAMALLNAGESIDILVTDLSMPGMDGLSLIRAAQAYQPNLPSVLLTGYAEEGASLAVTGAISGSFTLLRKPVTAEHLADRIAVLLQARRVARQAT